MRSTSTLYAIQSWIKEFPALRFEVWSAYIFKIKQKRAVTILHCELHFGHRLPYNCNLHCGQRLFYIAIYIVFSNYLTQQFKLWSATIHATIDNAVINYLTQRFTGWYVTILHCGLSCVHCLSDSALQIMVIEYLTLRLTMWSLSF